MLQPQRIATIATTEQPTQIAKSERSHFGDEKIDKKTKKIPLINQNKKIDEFECTEELNFKKPLVETKSKFQ